MTEANLLERITYNPAIFGGKPIVRGRRLAVEHVLDLLAANHTEAQIREDFPWIDHEDIQACMIYAARLVGRESIEPRLVGSDV